MASRPYLGIAADVGYWLIKCWVTHRGIHCITGLAVYPSPAGMSLTKFSLIGNNLLLPARESLVSDMPAGDGKIAYLFYSVTMGTAADGG